jgi:peptidoglycan/xylan/chitin deacetylase (PgdA/CDA1 family)
VSAPEPEGSSLVSVRPPAGVTVLTYDDGPTPGVTDRLHEVMAAGHEVALHGPDHLRLTSLPADAHATRFREAKTELEDLTGVAVRWSRPPYGAQDVASWRAARDVGLQPVLWSVSCLDWETHPQDDYLADLHAADPAGAVVLLHDGFADARDGVDDGPPPTLDRVALTRSVLDEIAGAGSTASSVGRALEGAEGDYRPWLEG